MPIVSQDLVPDTSTPTPRARSVRVTPTSFLSINVTPEECERALTHARERVSFLVWALENHRDPGNTRTTLWRYTEAEYCRQITQATDEMERLEQECDGDSKSRPLAASSDDSVLTPMLQPGGA